MLFFLFFLFLLLVLVIQVLLCLCSSLHLLWPDTNFSTPGSKLYCYCSCRCCFSWSFVPSCFSSSSCWFRCCPCVTVVVLFLLVADPVAGLVLLVLFFVFDLVVNAVVVVVVGCGCGGCGGCGCDCDCCCCRRCYCPCYGFSIGFLKRSMWGIEPGTSSHVFEAGVPGVWVKNSTPVPPYTKFAEARGTLASYTS